jgi:transposase
VELSVSVVAYRHRPVLLHEFLHAFHDHELKDGTKNAEILTYYERAKLKGDYSPQSHMMENVGEFFACAATTYLAGYTGQEPFLREKLQSSQPRFLEYLKAVFGPDSGRYEGPREGPDLKRLEKLKRNSFRFEVRQKAGVNEVE